jgi:hypothetical protein
MIDLDVVRTSLAAAASITSSEVSELKVFTGSVVLEATVPKFAAELLEQNFQAGVLRVLAAVQIVSLSLDMPTQLPIGSPTLAPSSTSVPSNFMSSDTPTTGPSPDTPTNVPSRATDSPTQMPSDSTPAYPSSVGIATASPTEPIFYNTIQFVRATVGDAAISQSRGRRSQVVVSMAFRAVTAAKKYRMEMRLALPTVTLAPHNETVVLGEPDENFAASSNLSYAEPPAVSPSSTRRASEATLIGSSAGARGHRAVEAPFVDRNLTSTPQSNWKGLRAHTEHRRRASPGSKPSSPASTPSSLGDSPGNKQSSVEAGETALPRSGNVGNVGPLTSPPVRWANGTEQGGSHQVNSAGQEVNSTGITAAFPVEPSLNNGQWTQPNATQPALKVLRATAVWAPLLDTSPRQEGGSLFRLSWTELNFSGKTEFYTVWFRVVDATGSQVLRCLTSNEDYSSAPSVEVGCGNNGSTTDQSSVCHPFWIAEQDVRSASASASTFAMSPFSLFNTSAKRGVANICDLESKSHKIHLFVLSCRGDPDAPACDFDNPSRSLLLDVSCEGNVKALRLHDDVVELSPTSCITCSTLDPFGDFCEASSTGSAASWSDWECVEDSYNEGCLEVTEPKASVTLSMCDHRDRYNIRVLACFDSECSSVSTTDDVFEFEFEHPSGVRARECAPRPSRTAVVAGTSVTAIVGGTIAAAVGSSVASSVGGSTTASGAGLVGCIQAVQFAAATSDMCGVQSQPVRLDIWSVMQNLNVFNLRFPMPDLSEYLPATPQLMTTISFCGITTDIDLVAQARGEVGDIFGANVLVGSLVIVTVTSMHFLVLVLTPRRWVSRVSGTVPFLKLELCLFLVGNQGLLISSTQLMGVGGDDGVCVAAGLVILMIPTIFLLFVLALLWRFVRPSSGRKTVDWDDANGWVLSTSKYEASLSDVAAVSKSAEDDPEFAGEDEETHDADPEEVEYGNEPASPGADVAQQDQQQKRPRRARRKGKGKIKIRLGAARSSTPAAGRSLVVTNSMFHRISESIEVDFASRFEPLLEGWHNKRLAWIGPGLCLITEYCLALAMGFGALATCRAEQVHR